MGSTQKTDNTTGWLGLLTALTDEELARYGEIAADQRRQEWRHAWAQFLLVGASAACLVWALRDAVVNGFSWLVAAGLALSIACAYWPYRQAVVRNLWRRHLAAVEREKARRRSSA